MGKYKILINLWEKRIKNRFFIVLIEKTYLLLIFAVFLILIIGGAGYAKNVFTGLLFYPEYARKLYYCLLFLSQVPFVMLRLWEKEKTDINYLLESLFKQGKIQKLLLIRNRLFCFLLDAVIIIFFVTRFSNLSYLPIVTKWLIFITLIQMLTELVLLGYMKIFGIMYNNKIIYNFINIIIPFLFGGMFICLDKYLWKYSNGNIILMAVFFVLQLLYYKIICLKEKMGTNIQQNSVVRSTIRINIGDKDIYLSRVKIGSLKFFLFCIVCLAFVGCYIKIFNASVMSQSVFCLIIALGLILFESERLNLKEIRVLHNLGANIFKYILILELLYYLISIVFVLLNALILSLVNNDNFIKILDNVDFLNYLGLFYISILFVNSLKLIIGLSESIVINFVVIVLTLAFVYVMVPYFSSLYGLEIVFFVSSIILNIVQFLEIRFYEKFQSNL